MKNYNTPYDDAFKTLLNDCDELIIPVINEIFSENYSSGEQIIRLSNELFLPMREVTQRKLITDSALFIGEKIYHIECQSHIDGTMLIRMFEYDAQIAVQDGELVEYGRLNVRFPNSAIIYLRNHQNTPKTATINIETPGGYVEYEIKTLMVQDYSIDEIFEKNLLFLIPFHIFSFEHALKHNGSMDIDEDLKVVQHHYVEIRDHLEQLAGRGDITEYEKHTIITMAKKVIDAIFANQEKVKESIGEIMGGKILDYEAKDIRNEGRSEGLSDGKMIAILELFASGDISGECAAAKIGCDMNDLETLLEKFKIERE